MRVSLRITWTSPPISTRFSGLSPATARGTLRFKLYHQPFV